MRPYVAPAALSSSLTAGTACGAAPRAVLPTRLHGDEDSLRETDGLE
jgi:hypothetical protein